VRVLEEQQPATMTAPNAALRRGLIGTEGGLGTAALLRRLACAATEV
jgi:hypothetical protein